MGASDNDISMDEIREGILDMLSDLHGDVDFNTREDLADDGVLDSFDIVTLIAEINDEFDVTVTADKIVPENFNSAEAIAGMVYELAQEDA